MRGIRRKGDKMSKSIAEHMRDVLNENGEEHVDIGRSWLWAECFERAGMISNKGSERLGYRVMDALDKSEMFEKSYINYNRKVRMFTLKEEYRR